MATACPSVINTAKASMIRSSRMGIRGQRSEGADGAADLVKDVRSAEVVGVTAALHAVR